MTDFEKRHEDATIIEEWPNPESDYEDEDDWDYEVDDSNEPKNYEVKFKVTGATVDEINWISRYLFAIISKELSIPHEKLDDLEIEED